MVSIQQCKGEGISRSCGTPFGRQQLAADKTLGEICEQIKDPSAAKGRLPF